MVDAEPEATADEAGTSPLSAAVAASTASASPSSLPEFNLNRRAAPSLVFSEGTQR